METYPQLRILKKKEERKKKMGSWAIQKRVIGSICNFGEKIFQQGLKELQLASDMWGVGNKKQSRDVKA